MNKKRKMMLYSTRITPTRKRRGVYSGAMSGLATLLTIGTPHASSLLPPSSSMQSLRGDMVRLGADMRRVIAREKRSEKTGD